MAAAVPARRAHRRRPRPRRPDRRVDRQRRAVRVLDAGARRSPSPRSPRAARARRRAWPSPDPPGDRASSGPPCATATPRPAHAAPAAPRRAAARAACDPTSASGRLDRRLGGGRRARASPAAGSSPSGGLAPSRAHGSSNSTRHLPSSPCWSARRARNDLPERPLKPVTGRAVRPVAISSLRHRLRQRLARLALPDHEAAARVLARPAREALAVLDDVLAADRARAEVGPRDADLLELRVELGDGAAGELRDVAHEALARLLARARSGRAGAPSRR